MRTIDELGISKTPWYVRDNGMAGVYINAVSCDSEENQIAVMDTYISGVMSIQKEAANARLIAAAPDCYEALAAVVSWYERNKPLPYEENGIQMIMDYAKKAIAKASGEEVK